jgi:hypothetical protein
MPWSVIGGPYNSVFVWPTREVEEATPPVVPPPVSSIGAGIGASAVRTINWGAEVRKGWGDDYYKPEEVYRFNNDRTYNDSGPHGAFYE